MLTTYIDWLAHTALPFWAARGFDPGGDRFHERLDVAGTPVDVPYRAMVQARQIYVYAHAATLGWFREGAQLADRAMTSLLRDFCEEGPRQASFAFSIDRTGRVVSEVRDAYTHAFILFAMAWLYRLKGDPALLVLADKIFAYIDAELADPVNGGLYDAVPIVGRSKRQNPLMHLLEACLFLEQAAPGRGYIDRGGAIVALLGDNLYRPDPGVLLEHFAEDWSSHADPGKVAVWEPGHHMEWVWLLAEYARLAGDDTAARATALFASARDHGFAPNGLLYDEVGLDLRPLKRSHRLWPHSEAIKAAIVRNDFALADRMAATLLDTFVGRPFAAGWLDQLSADGDAIVDYVPASSLYHLFLAGAEAAAGLAKAGRAG